MKKNKEIVIFQDVENEHNISLTLYANRLFRGIQNLNPNIGLSLYKPKLLRYPRMITRLVSKTPLLRFYGETDFVSRHILYPIMARYNQGQINHITGTNGDIVRCMDPRRTVITCHDLQLIASPLVRYSKAHKGFKWYKRRIDALARAARVIAISEHTKRDILKYTSVSEDNISVIYNAVDQCFRPINDKSNLKMVGQKIWCR